MLQGGGEPPQPLRVAPLWGVGSFIITSSSGNLNSTLHCIALTQD